jgi:membrane associated rhomboid family serine protease
MFFPIKDYNPTNRTAYVTIFLIAINIAVFVYQAYISPQPLEYHIVNSAMVPAEVTHFKNMPLLVGENRFGQKIFFKGRKISPFLSILTSIFMHASLWHLLGNMLFLWIFGNNIEDYLGKFKFIIFYLLSGVGAALIHVLFHFNSQIPVIGASGAVSGIMGAYLVLYPHAKVRTLVFIFIFITFMDIPAYLFLVVWFAFQFLYAGSGSGIAWVAHVGGFVIGVLLIKQLQKKYRKPIIEIIE